MAPWEGDCRGCWGVLICMVVVVSWTCSSLRATGSEIDASQPINATREEDFKKE